MVHMSHAYLTEKQMLWSFWCFAIKHAAKMMNVIPGKYKGKLASPFMIIHGVRPDQWAWLPMFSLCYFHHEKDSNALRSKNQAHTLDGIIIRWSPTSTAILVYNPCNQKYYKPDSYCLDPYCLPSLVYTTIKNDSGLFVSLHWNEVASISESFPPGTRVADVHPIKGKTRLGTVMDTPFNPNLSLYYLVLYDDDTSSSILAASMPALIPKPIVDILDTSHLLLPFLQVSFKITFEKDSQYHKGYLSHFSDGTYWFSYKSHINKKHKDRGVPLPNLTTTWQDLCTEGLLLPGHSWSSFDRTHLAHHVSTQNLLWECPRSLLTALNMKHPNWMRLAGKFLGRKRWYWIPWYLRWDNSGRILHALQKGSSSCHSNDVCPHYKEGWDDEPP